MEAPLFPDSYQVPGRSLTCSPLLHSTDLHPCCVPHNRFSLHCTAALLGRAAQLPPLGTLGGANTGVERGAAKTLLQPHGVTWRPLFLWQVSYNYSIPYTLKLQPHGVRCA